MGRFRKALLQSGGQTPIQSGRNDDQGRYLHGPAASRARRNLGTLRAFHRSNRRINNPSPSQRPGQLLHFFETLAPPPGVSCPGIAKGPHRLRPAGTSDGPGPVPEGLQDKAWRVTRGPATFHPVSEAPPRSSILKSPVVELKSHFFRGIPRRTRGPNSRLGLSCSGSRRPDQRQSHERKAPSSEGSGWRSIRNGVRSIWGVRSRTRSETTSAVAGESCSPARLCPVATIRFSKPGARPM